MEIKGIGSTGNVGAYETTGRRIKGDEAQTQVRADRVDIGSIARTVTKEVREAPDVRPDKVKEAREKLSRGDYFTEEKFSTIAEKMLEGAQ